MLHLNGVSLPDIHQIYHLPPTNQSSSRSSIVKRKSQEEKEEKIRNHMQTINCVPFMNGRLTGLVSFALVKEVE